jgi:hypothetical protein
MEASPNEHLIETQASVRSANERFYAVAAERVPADQLIPFLCECADGGCRGRVNMKIAEYVEIHGDRDRYAILRDHAVVDGEGVIERRALFDIVRKGPPVGL